jgi:tRNA A-37 threonylcarbamoyl transferase component Bud32/TolB-like protein
MSTLEILQEALRDKYKVDREIGAGGMATVYRAEDLKHHRQVAIKVLRPELAASLGTDRFLREIEMAARLQHPHVLPLYDSGAAAGFLYYVMPFVEGESLRDKLSRDGSLPVEVAVQLVREVASALDYAHTHGVVHRDIKPENILLSGGHAVVADFGIARALDAASGGEKLTGMGLSIGTPAYMSPEQATASDEVDARSDVYSLGCVLYESLAGQPAFSGPSIQSVITKSISGPRPHVRSIRKTIPLAIDEVIVKSLAQDPAERYPSAAAFSDALGKALMGEMAGGRRRWVPMVVGVLTACLLVGGWVGYQKWTNRSPVKNGAELIAVLPFTTAGSGVDLLGEGMVDLLSTNLNAVGGINTVDPRSVLSRWHKRKSTGDRADALAVGRSLDAGSVLMGSVVSAGTSVRIYAELSSVTGETLARVQVNGPADNVIALVDSLSLSLLREIWSSKEPIPSLRLGAITSTSVDAIRAYMEGEQYYRKANWDSAISAFTRAVTADSTFALANFRLALSIGWTGGWQAEQSVNATEAAYRNLKRLPERDRALITGYRLFTLGRLEAVDSLRHYVNQYPKDPDGWFMMADAQFHLRALLPLSPAELKAPFDSVIKLDPTLVAAYFHPIEMTLQYRDSVGYQSYMARMDSAAPSEESGVYRLSGQAVWGPNPDSVLLSIMGQRHMAGGGGAALMSRFSEDHTDPHVIEQAAAALAGSAGQQNQAWANMSMSRASILVGLGELKAAQAVADSVILFSPDMGMGVKAIPIFVGLAPKSTLPIPPEIQQRMDVAVTKSIYPAEYRLNFDLSAGDLAGARHVLDLAMAPSNPFTPEMRSMLTAFRGWSKVLAGDTVGGIAEMKSGLRGAGHFGVDWNSSHLRFRLAQYLASRPATREEGIKYLRNGFDGGTDVTYLPLSKLLLARALEDKGDRAGAAAAYSHFLRLWKDADPSLQARIDEAKEGLKRTTGELPTSQ